MFISVIVPTHSLDNTQNLIDAVDSLLNQTYKDMEILIVVDGNQELYENVVEIYNTQEKLKIVAIKENVGLGGARNEGVKAAKGDAIAFIDDDAVADKKWIECLVDTYQKLDAIAVGGKMLPLWLPQKPDYFPEELGWLVGITQEGFAEEKVAEVRNTFGSNMSFRKQVFEKVGLFSNKTGFKRGTSSTQGQETEFASRMKAMLGKGIIYNPQAVVYHKIPLQRTKPRTLLRRAFYQGYSKALLKRFNPSSMTLNTETSYLNNLLFAHIPRRIKGIFSSNCIKEVKQLSFLLAVTINVGVGFAYGYMKR
jgi:glycosyltransferase involved in cell wall biosynthesis